LPDEKKIYVSPHDPSWSTATIVRLYHARLYRAWLYPD
jgi:hypothetical protein